MYVVSSAVSRAAVSRSSVLQFAFILLQHYHKIPKVTTPKKATKKINVNKWCPLKIPESNDTPTRSSQEKALIPPKITTFEYFTSNINRT